MSVVRAVAEAEDVVPAELPVLSEILDPEALDGLVTDVDGEGGTDVRVSFRYCGYIVVVTADSVTLLTD
ncbi:HalOD1 output domain-containing protein [Halorubrum rubrum]|uniref:HalOD1 output domain-containing protein n=1 Tax=Halorubrum rubrum TaxID=1126240 RepID=A0ABD5QYQ6_9EURY|nr:HalOD1 output domain-containing protein [Halorubrum rubrum]